MPVQERLHRRCHTAVPDRVTEKYHIIVIEIFNSSLDRRIIALPDGRQFFLRAFQHGIIVVIVRRFRLDFQQVAAERRLNQLRHTPGIVRARSVKHQIATVTAGSRRIGFSIVVAARLLGRFGLSGGERLTIGTAAGCRRKDGNQ